MVHQCVHCSKIYPDASRELLEGCSNDGCGSRFFYYIKKMPEQKQAMIPPELSMIDKKQVEKDVREMIGAEEEDVPVILDLESIRIAGPGKFEIDVVNLMDKKRPLIYKLDEGKYVIDLASTLKVNLNEINKKIKRPKRIRRIKEVKNGEEKQEEQKETNYS